jgi:hypothetical protein|tara:strand:+ start:198 stop:740 length:543 start_codon:yes stop_codon:yes gene_type:complete
MQTKIDLKKEVYSDINYPRIIDTKFNELGTISINEQIDTTPTTNEFFDLYNSLFYEIPSYGDINSHQYLIETSAEYIDFDANQDEITALRAEITDLRRQLLEAQVATAEALTGEKLGIDVNSINNEALADNDEFSKIMKNLGNVPTSPTEANTTNTTGTSNTSGNSSSTSGGGGSSGGGY